MGFFLCLQGNTYHYRRVVPTNLRPILLCREIKRTLSTGNKRIAQQRACIIGSAVEELFSLSFKAIELKISQTISATLLKIMMKRISFTNGAAMDRAHLQHLIKEFFWNCLQTQYKLSDINCEYAQKMREGTLKNLYSFEELAHVPRQKIDEAISNLDPVLTKNDSAIHKSFFDFAQNEHKLKRFNRYIKPAQEIANKLGQNKLPSGLLQQLSLAELDACRVVLAQLEGEYSPIEQKYAIHEFSPNQVASQKKQDSFSLSECAENYFAQHIANQSSGTQRKWHTFINEFFAIFGEKITTDSLTHKMGRKYISTIQRLPKNRTKFFPNTPIDELVNLKNVEHNCNTTLNDRISKLSHFFDWCVAQGYLEINILSGKRLPDKSKNQNTYVPFTKHDLLNIFDDTYKERTKKKAFYYWMPLLALFTGARLSELITLAPQDLREYETESKQKIWYLALCANHKGKTENATRYVPLHPILVETLHFPDFVQSIKNKDRIFYDCPIPSTGGISKRASDWFAKYFFPKIQIESPPAGNKKSFHSFRNTAINMAKQGNAEQSKAEEIFGHSSGRKSMSYDYYANKYSPELTYQEVICKMKLPIPPNFFDSLTTITCWSDDGKR